MAAEPLPWKVGERSRIRLAPGKTSRCLVLCVGLSDEGQPIYDVLLTAVEATGSASATASSAAKSHEGPGGDCEISGVPAKDLSLLQPFELNGSLEKSLLELKSESDPEKLASLAETVKDMGNALFKLGDTGAAAEIFVGVLQGLEPPTGVGASVLVRPKVIPTDGAYRYRPAMISEAEEGEGGGAALYGVIYEEGDEEDGDEEDEVTSDRITAVPRAAPCVSCAARLNLARCRFKEARHPEVVDACTRVIAICKVLIAEKTRDREERTKLRGHSLTALRLRGTSHLAQNHIGLAGRDARSMARSASKDEERTQAARFMADVEKKSKSLQKANRKLARDVTAWVNASMAKHDEASAVPGDLGSKPEDDDVAPPLNAGADAVNSFDGFEESKGNNSRGSGGSWFGSWLR